MRSISPIHTSITLLRNVLCVCLLALLATTGFAQQASGGIKGKVSDPQKAVIPGANVVVKNTSTGAERSAITENDGTFQVSQLNPGDYEIVVTAQGFKTSKLVLALSIGESLNTEIGLEVGGATDTVNISADTAVTLNTSDFKVDGVINRQKIDSLPLNGRNFLQLAQLEPGVKVSTGTPGQYNNLFNVSIGGGNAALTRITVDGGNVVDPVTGYSAQNYSVDTVQEFQISTFNFDLSTGVTSVGAVNIVSRTGKNDYFGSAFAFYRDNHMSAYPTLKRVNNSTTNPFFRRLQGGFTLGGPIVKDKLVWFTNLERSNQTAALSFINSGNPQFDQFNAVTSSPYKGWLYNARVDYNVNSKNTAYLRGSSDVNQSFAPSSGNVLPSSWRYNKNDVYQVQAGWVSTLRPSLTNSLTLNWQYIGNKNLIPSQQCSGCIGIDAAQVRVNGSSFNVGNSTDAPQNRALHRYETTDNLTWVAGKHVVQTGVTLEPAYGIGQWSFVDPALVVAHDPRTVALVNSVVDNLVSGFGGLSPQIAGTFAPFASLLKLPLPAAFTTPGAKISYNDILQLPVAFVLRGLGDGAQPPPNNADYARHTFRFRTYGQDTWQAGKGLTLKYGLSWIYENKLWNHDLKKSALLQDIYGGSQANPLDKSRFAPSVGFAYNVGQKNKTVVRGGFSMAYDTSLYVNRLTERANLGPIGNGRVLLPGDFFQNSNQFIPTAFAPGYGQLVAALPTIAQQIVAASNTPGLTTQQKTDLLTVASIVPSLPAINPAVGARLNSATLQTLPTRLTTAQALTMLQQQGTAVQGQFNQLGSAGIIGLDFFKTTSQAIIDPNIKIPYSLNYSFGVQHELPWNMILNADFVFRRYLHGFFSRDRALTNRAASLGGPVIRFCNGAEATNPAVKCLNGEVQVLESNGKDTYKALLVKLDKRFNKHFSFTGSYSFSRSSGYNYTRDLTNPFAFYGPQGNDRPHSFTFSSVVKAKWGINVGLVATYESAPPLTASVPGANNSDFNGDGTNGDFLPGLKWNSLGRGVSKDDLVKLVANYNTTLAGKVAPRGGTFPTITLPASFEFGDIFQSHDIRLSKDFKFGEKVTFELVGEVFNIFNLSNKSGYSGSIDTGFGLPTSKANPIFGVGGPRIFQIGGRLKF